MGCPRLTYHQNPSPLKVVYSAKSHHQKIGANVLYFGARYYDSETSVWLSVDPLSDKYPHLSPYMYAEGNPVMMVDPNGMATIARKQEKEDWFMNEKTGDVYFNSDMRKGDEGTGAMKGKGWVHMGENGMFDNSSEGGSDREVNSQNKDLQTDYHSGKSSNNEAYYNGDNAEEFMDRVGYDKKKKEYMYFEKIDVMHTGELPTKVDYSTIKVESWQYVKKSLKNLLIKDTKTLMVIEPKNTEQTNVYPRTYRTTSTTLKKDTYGKELSHKRQLMVAKVLTKIIRKVIK